MTLLRRVISTVDGTYLVSVFGGLYLVLGAVQVRRDLLTNDLIGEILVDSILFGLPAGVLLYGGYWIRRTDIRPDLYSRIAGWCLGGSIVMLTVTGLLVLNPDARLGDPLRGVGIHTAVGTISGMGVGIMEAASITRAAEAEESEQALKENKNQLRALIDVLPVAVFVAEADGRIVEWNEAAEAIWGGEVAESQSVAEYEMYDGWWADTGEPVEPDEWALARALRGEEVTEPDEIEIEGFDGNRRTVLNHGMPVRDANGEVTRAVVTLIDITERKAYERKLEESNRRLEQFAYAASHDLQEPLRMVSSYLQLIEHRYADDLDEDGREFIDFAVDGAERMRNMIRGLLQYSRVDSRGDPFEPVELDALLEDVRDDLQVTITEHRAEITVDSLPTVSGDENQLRQVFQNVLENAIEYSGDGPPQVHVSAERSGERWTIAVRDDGIGIDPADADRIFDVFERLHTHDDGSGTGIGLALCERIVDRHGGDIWVESEPGEGSTFYVTLPAADDPATPIPRSRTRDEHG